MADELIKTLTNEAGDERVLIVRRDNGVCTYRRQWKEGGGWAQGPMPVCTIPSKLPRTKLAHGYPGWCRCFTS